VSTADMWSVVVSDCDCDCDAVDVDIVRINAALPPWLKAFAELRRRSATAPVKPFVTIFLILDRSSGSVQYVPLGTRP